MHAQMWSHSVREAVCLCDAQHYGESLDSMSTRERLSLSGGKESDHKWRSVETECVGSRQSSESDELRVRLLSKCWVGGWVFAPARENSAGFRGVE